jgi:hypothetical protein
MDTISPRPSLASGKGGRPRRIHVSSEGPLKQRTHLRLARGPVFAKKQPHLRLARGPVFAKKQPWPDCHAIAWAFNARMAWHLILTRALQSTEPKWPQSLRRSTDRPDKKTAPLASLRLLCHSTEWGWQQPTPASGAIGNSASPDLRWKSPRGGGE